jgi:hypothetical protein
VTSVFKDCLGCGLPTEAPSILCLRCAELVELDRYCQPAFRFSDRLRAASLRETLPDLLQKMIPPGLTLVATLAGVLAVDAVLCQLSGHGCSLFVSCLLA